MNTPTTPRLTSVPTIRGLRTRLADVALREPAITAAGIFRTFPVVLIDLETEEGVRGRSYLFTYDRFLLKPMADLVHAMGDLLAGKPLHPLDLREFLHKRMLLLGTPGLIGMVLGAIDVLLWDAAARAAGLPLAALLGAAPRPIRAYLTLKNMSAEGAAREAARAVEKGFRGVKLKVGASLRQDVEAVEAIRRAVGPDAAIMVDYNQVLSVPEAIARGRVLDDYGLAWIEEPTLASDYEGQAEIARQVRTSIMIGESWHGIPDAARALACRSSDCIMPNVIRIGGVTGLLRVAHLAATHGVPLSGHSVPELTIHALAAIPTVDWIEYVDIVESILQEPLAVRDGCITAPDRLGLGIEWDEDALRPMLA